MALYVDPGAWGAGVGGALLDETLGLMRAQRGPLAALWVLGENERAIGFYRSRGWTPDGAERDEDPWGIIAHVIRMRLAL